MAVKKLPVANNRFTILPRRFLQNSFLALLLVLSHEVVVAEPAASLEDLFRAAIEYSPRLNIAREQWNIGTARKQSATGQLLPQVSATGSFSDNRRETEQQVLEGDQLVTRDVVNKFNGEKYRVQLSQVLFNWQVFAQRGRAAHFEDQVEAEYYEELSWVLVEVTESYLNVLQAEDLLRTVRAEKEAVDSQLKQVQQMYERQLVKITDLY